MRQFEEEIINMMKGGKIGKSGRFEPPKTAQNDKETTKTEICEGN